MIILLLVIFDSVVFSYIFSLASLSEITEILSLRLAEKTLEFCSVFHTRKMTRLSSHQVKYTCPVNWDLIFWLQETELLLMCSCRCLFHLEGVSRVKLNNAGKYQPSFNWLQPAWFSVDPVRAVQVWAVKFSPHPSTYLLWTFPWDINECLGQAQWIKGSMCPTSPSHSCLLIHKKVYH